MRFMPESGRVARPELILASASPQRLRLLQQVGVEPVVRPSAFVESSRDGELATDLVRRLAVGKATLVAEGKNVVVGADTLVVVDGDALGKAADEAIARHYLARLSGRSHQVLTGVAVVCGDRVVSAVVSTDVNVRKLEPSEIDWYIGTGEWQEKAGAYGIQGCGALLVDSINGDYSNIVGLPLVALDGLLDDLGRPLRSWTSAR
jgi:septum formation protein